MRQARCNASTGRVSPLNPQTLAIRTDHLEYLDRLEAFLSSPHVGRFCHGVNERRRVERSSATAKGMDCSLWTLAVS